MWHRGLLLLSALLIQALAKEIIPRNRPVFLPNAGKEVDNFETLYHQDKIVHRHVSARKCYVIPGLDDNRPSLLYMTSGNLSKFQIRKLSNVVQEFCKNFKIMTAVAIPVDRNNKIFKKDKNLKSKNYRNRRNANGNGNGYPYKSNGRGKYRGQTQSQYLNVGSNGSNPGRAEAESTRDGSRAVVTGTSGMGQAQSQSFGSGCEDCYDRTQNQGLAYNGGGRQRYPTATYPGPSLDLGRVEDHGSNLQPGTVGGPGGVVDQLIDDRRTRPGQPRPPGTFPAGPTSWDKQGQGSLLTDKQSPRGPGIPEVSQFQPGTPVPGQTYPQTGILRGPPLPHEKDYATTPQFDDKTYQQRTDHENAGGQWIDQKTPPAGGPAGQTQYPAQPTQFGQTQQPGGPSNQYDQYSGRPTAPYSPSGQTQYPGVPHQQPGPYQLPGGPQQQGQPSQPGQVTYPPGTQFGQTTQPGQGQIPAGPPSQTQYPGPSNQFGQTSQTGQTQYTGGTSNQQRQPVPSGQPPYTGGTSNQFGQPTQTGQSQFPAGPLNQLQPAPPGQTQYPGGQPNQFVQGPSNQYGQPQYPSTQFDQTQQPPGQLTPLGQTVPTGQNQYPAGTLNQFGHTTQTGQTQYPAGPLNQYGQTVPPGQTQFPGVDQYSQTQYPGGPLPQGQTQYPAGQTTQHGGLPQGQTQYPGGQTTQHGGQTQYPGGQTTQHGGLPQGQTQYPVGQTTQHGGQTQYPGGQTTQHGGHTQYPGGQTTQHGGQTQYPGGQTTQHGGLPQGQTQYPGGQTTQHGGLPQGQTQYPGGQTPPHGGLPQGQTQYPGGQTTQHGGQTQYPGRQTTPHGGLPQGQTQYPGGQTTPHGGQTTQHGGLPQGQTQYPGGQTTPHGGQTTQHGGLPQGQTQYPGGQTTPHGGLPQGQTQYPGGQTTQHGGQTQYPGGQTTQHGGQTQYPGGQTTQHGGLPQGQTQYPGGQTTPHGGQTQYPGGQTTPQGQFPQGQSQYPVGQTTQHGGQTQYPGGQTTQHGGQTQYPGQTTQHGGPAQYPRGPQQQGQPPYQGQQHPHPDQTGYYPTPQQYPYTPGGQTGSTDGQTVGYPKTHTDHPGYSKLPPGYPTNTQYQPPAPTSTQPGYPLQPGQPSQPYTPGQPYPGQTYPQGGQTPHLPDSRPYGPGYQPTDIIGPSTLMPTEQVVLPGAHTLPGGAVDQTPSAQYDPRTPPGQQPSQWPGYPQAHGSPSTGPDGKPGFYDKDGSSQAETSIQQIRNETQASAMSNGRLSTGLAQTQISGTYSGSGGFSAQAQTSDSNKGAQSQISVGKMGAISSAQGNAGYGQSQAQLQLGSETGATTAEAQSGGWNHGTNTQVQASSKGGMADAQANGPGSTSSQAQIGFQPYQEATENENQNLPFYGGGMASAQSGKYAGQSQTQIQGKFKYGISYNGAAQAGSGSKDNSSRNKTTFKPLDLVSGHNMRPDREVNIQPKDNKNEKQVIDNGYEKDSMQEAESKRIPQTHSNNFSLNENRNISKSQDFRTSALPQIPRQPLIKTDSEDFDDKITRDTPPAYENYDNDDAEEEDELDEDGDFFPPSETNPQNIQYPRKHKDIVVQQAGKNQKQHIILGPLTNNGAHVIQDSSDTLKAGMVFQPGEIIPGTQGYTIPIGFRGRVSSVSHGNDTFSYSDDNGESQAQTVNLTPGSRNVTYSKSPLKTTPSLRSWTPPNYQNAREIHSKHRVDTYNLRNNYYNPDSYVSVTKSETGQLNTNKNNPEANKKYSHTYYTKSSTCGYFTFNCNIVYGSNGQTNVCTPKPRINADGTPVQC